MLKSKHKQELERKRKIQRKTDKYNNYDNEYKNERNGCLFNYLLDLHILL
jgi:hypothetical protein